jgi:hypothetical protein
MKYYEKVEVNSMSYTLTHLTPRLVLITWRRTPIADEAKAFIQSLQDILDQASEPLYFISDLRRGRIVDVRIIHQLSQLTEHPHWAGSTAFSQNPISKIFLGSFQRLLTTTSDKNTTFDQPEDAIAFLEHLSPHVGEAVDWAHVLNNSTGNLYLPE